MKRAIHKPTVPGIGMAIAAATVSIALRLDSRGQWLALFVAVLGIGFLAGGDILRRREPSVLGTAFFAVGTAWMVGSLGIAISSPPLLTQRIELVPSLLGLFVLFVGLAPIRRGWERRLVATGAALLWLGVVTGGVVQNTGPVTLLIAGIAVVFAWDAAEQSVSLGRQIGREAKTIRAEVTHGFGTAGVGVGVFIVTALLYRFGADGLPLGGFVALLVAGFVLAIALRR